MKILNKKKSLSTPPLTPPLIGAGNTGVGSTPLLWREATSLRFPLLWREATSLRFPLLWRGGARGGVIKLFFRLSRLSLFFRLSRLSLFFLLSLSPLLPAKSQTSSHFLGLGPSRGLDTYLTPEHFSGTGYTYLYIKDFQKRDTLKHWTSTVQHELDFSSTKDRSRNASNLEGTYNLYLSRYYNLRLLQNLRLQLGGTANACLGFIYNLTSSNNPAQARAALNLMPSATAAYDFSISRQRFTASYQLQLPLVGLMFSPNYGQSYYEIFSRGNYDHNIVPTTFVSAPTFRQIVSLHWHYSRRYSLSLSYLGNYQQAKVNNLKQHVYTHRFLLGLTKKI